MILTKNWADLLLLVGLAGISIGLGQPAFAQSTAVVQTVNLSGQASPRCLVGQPSPQVVDLGALAAQSGPRAGRTAAVAPAVITLPNSFCNYANSRLQIEVSALRTTDTPTASANFARAINYTATIGPWASPEATVTTAAAADGSQPTATGLSAVQPAARVADLVLRLSDFSAPNDAYIVAGTYSADIRVTLGPANGAGL